MELPLVFERVLRSPRPRRVAKWLVTLVVLAVVVWFARATFERGWDQLSTTTLRLSAPWMLAAGGLYLAGLAPMAGYWRRVLRSLGERPPAMAVARAYYLGHLGKYVPGKALVAVLRTGALVSAGCDLRRVLVSVFLETLTFMATGGALATLLLIGRGDAAWPHVLLAAGLAAMVGLPVTPPVARRLARRVWPRSAPGEPDEVAERLQSINWSLSASGVAAATVAWAGLGLSLWATLRAVGIESAAPIGQLGLWIESVTLPVVAGFLSLIPGGLVVRDALQMELLAPQVPAEAALVTAALWRLISVVAEGVGCVILEGSRLGRGLFTSRDDPPRP